MRKSDQTISPNEAARHVAEKIRNAIQSGMTVDVFGKKRLAGVVLDLEMTKAFIDSVERAGSDFNGKG